MAKPIDPFKQLVWHATDRLYSPTTDITIDLDNDPLGTIQRLITEPEAFGRLQHLSPLQKQHWLNQLVTVARAYVLNKRKPKDHDGSQPVLPLPRT